MRSSWIWLPLLIVTACGGDDESACEAYGRKLCDQACACTEGDACSYTIGGATITFDSESDCRGLFSLCGSDPDDDFDYEGCAAALDEATCEPGADDVSVLQHPTCDDGGG